MLTELTKRILGINMAVDKYVFWLFIVPAAICTWIMVIGFVVGFCIGFSNALNGG